MAITIESISFLWTAYSSYGRMFSLCFLKLPFKGLFTCHCRITFCSILSFGIHLNNARAL